MKRLLRLCGLCCLILGSLCFVRLVNATTTQSIILSNIPLTIDQLQEFEVNIQLFCSGCSDSYLRGVFYPSGTSYFGYTQDNSGNWSNAPGQNCMTFYKIAQSDLNVGSWSGTLKIKPDIASSYYAGPGEYLFKVGRYTPSCGSASVWSSETTIAITGPSPTPTPEPTNTPTPTTSSTPTPTNTPIPSKAPTPIRALTATPKTASPAEEATDEATSFVLGEETKNSLVASPSGKSLKTAIISTALVALGLAILSGYFVWQKRNAAKPPENE